MLQSTQVGTNYTQTTTYIALGLLCSLAADCRRVFSPLASGSYMAGGSAAASATVLPQSISDVMQVTALREPTSKYIRD